MKKLLAFILVLLLTVQAVPSAALAVETVPEKEPAPEAPGISEPEPAGTAAPNGVSGPFTYEIVGTGAMITKYTGTAASVTIPETIGGGYTVTSIGGGAFMRNSTLTSVTFPDSVVDIYNEAFSNCPALTEVSFGAGLSFIAARAFYSCTALETVTLPASVSMIDYEAFGYCTALTEVFFNAEAVSDGAASAFSHAGRDAGGFAVTFGDTVRRIPGYMFSDCIYLKTAVISSSVTEIGTNAFFGCTGADYFVYDGTALEWNLIEIGGGNEILDEITIFFKEGPGDPDYTWEVVGRSVVITGYAGTQTELTVPGSIAGYPVSGVGTRAFQGKDFLTSVTLPESVGSIGAFAFEGCGSLTAVTVMNRTAAIDGDAFSGAEALSAIRGIDCSTALCFAMEHDLEFQAVGTADHVTDPDDPGTVVREPSCEEEGVLEKVCLICGGTARIPIPATGHTPGAPVRENVVEPTYTEDGSCDEVIRCTVCGKELSRETVILPKYDLSDFTWSVTEGEVTITGYTGTLSAVSIPGQIGGDRVAVIGRHAFAANETLTAVSFPDSLTTIQEGAFSGCSRLTEVILPRGLTLIGRDAFAGCSRLEKVLCYAEDLTVMETDSTIPSVFTDAGTEGPGILVIFGDSVERVPDSLFASCQGMKEVRMPHGLTEIGENAFLDCSGLVEVSLPDTLATIGEYAFYGCTGLTEVTLPEGVRNVGTYAFCECTGLSEVYFNAAAAEDSPDTYYSAFYDAGAEDGLRLIVGGQAARIPSGLVSRCARLTEVILAEGVGEIGASAFSGCTSLTAIRFPESLAAIGDNAFSDCTGLKELTLTGGLTAVGSSAFSGCSGITLIRYDAAALEETESLFSGVGQSAPECRVIFGDKVDRIPDSLFRDCSGLTAATFSAPSAAIGEYAFYQCTGLTEVSVTGGIRSIGNYAFCGCSGLAEAVVPDGVESLGDYAFSRCTGLAEVRLPGTLKESGKYAFSYCSGLKTVSASEGVEKISVWSFYGCTGLTSADLSRTVTAVDTRAFYGCTGLTQISFPDALAEIGNSAFEGCTALTEVTVPGNVRNLGGNAFKACSGLTRAVLSEGTANIGAGAFRDCTGLTELELPGTLLTVSNYAFSGCTSLKDVYYNGTEDEWSSVRINDNNECLTEAEIHCTGAAGPEFLYEIRNGSAVVTGYTGSRTDIVIPDTIDGYQVTEIAEGAFAGNAAITSVSIPESVTGIGYGAFRSCTGLAEVFYGGSPTAWHAITVAEGNEPLSQATIHYGKEDPVPAFRSQSLVLSGQIGLNFFLELPEIYGVDYAESYMTFTIGKDTGEYRDGFDPDCMNTARTRYGFTCYVNSIQMADTITAVFHYGDGKTVTKEYSAAQYIDFFEKNIGSFNSKTISLIRAIADFGHYEQIYLASVNHWTIGDTYTAMDRYYTQSFDYASILTAVSGKAFVKDIESSKVSKATYKLHLDSTTTVDVYLTVPAGTALTASATFNGKTYRAAKQPDGRYMVQIPDIAAHQLGDMITVTGSAGGAFSVMVSALSYTRSVLANNLTVPEKDGLSALYHYYKAVLAYRN
ncbi:MAG: leucine-rich repeat domain-containing protein [Oscillospiraceae bacterium]|nr:leucine-rich repeat domain-containing protein [Oscillospiraceae bacterium]